MTHWPPAIGIWLVLCVVAPATQAELVFTEIMYHPASDDDGDEFIELLNPGPEDVSLQGWCVDGVRLCFGAGSVAPAGGYVVLAGDAERFQATYGFEADFEYAGRLSNAGETLELRDAGGQVVDEVTYGDGGEWPVTPDGLGPSLEVIDPDELNDTPRNWRACRDERGHTAGQVNSVDAQGLPPWITDVQHLTDPEPDEAIHVSARVEDADDVFLIYVIDFGTEIPGVMFDDGRHDDGDAGDGVYGGAIPAQMAESLVRYRITAAGATGTQQFPRDDDTARYDGTVVDDPDLASTLPILQWFMHPDDYAEALRHFDTDEFEPAVVYYNTVLYDNISVRIRGGAPARRDYPKKHWKFRFAHGHDFADQAFLDGRSVDQFNMQSSYLDKSYMREMLSYESFRMAGVPGSLTSPLRLQFNGEFFGLYIMVEALDLDFLQRNNLDAQGAWYKAFSDCRFFDLEGLRQRYEKKTRPHEDYDDLLGLVDAINHFSSDDRRDFFYANVNLPGLINYLAVQCVIHSNDHVRKNYYLYRDAEGTDRWTKHPWDMDLTFGKNLPNSDAIWGDRDYPRIENTSPSHPLFGDREHRQLGGAWNRFIDALYDYPDIRAMYFRRLRTLVDTLLVRGRYERRIEELAPLIAGEAERDRDTWGQLGERETLDQALDLLRNNYLEPRRNHLQRTHRIPGEIPDRQTDAPKIVINEIMYHPAQDSEAEFVELYNPSETEAVDLSGWSMEGVNLTIPGGMVILPDEYVVFVRNDTVFRAAHAGVVFVGAQYGGKLDNGGERIILRDRSRRFVDQVEYGRLPPWPLEPDGGGPSLERVDPAQERNHAGNWAASLVEGGSPGARNTTFDSTEPLPSLFINEVLALNVSINEDEQGDFDPWVEIYNASGEVIDLGGMFLSNDFDDPFRWPIPEGVILEDGGWLLIWADGEPQEGPLHAGFRLSVGGDAVALYGSDARLIDYARYVDAEPDESFGRIPDGRERERRFLLATPAAANHFSAASVFLNEYNAVADDMYLKDFGTDTYWGRIEGNGGDWFELVVGVDHADLRGFTLSITNDTGGDDETREELIFTDHELWSDLRRGTIITVAEDLPTDASYDPLLGDWWIHVQAAADGDGEYITNDDFQVSNRNWQLAVLDSDGNVIFGPAGEGVRPADGIGSDEVFQLREDPNPYLDALGEYEDGTMSTFGAPNRFSGEAIQNFDETRSTIGFDLSLHVAPDSERAVQGEIVTVILDVANLASEIDAVRAVIEYDPYLLQLISIEPAELDLDPPAEGWVETVAIDDGGIITYAVEIQNGGGRGTGDDGRVATLRFTTLAESASRVRFLPDEGERATRLRLAEQGSEIIPQLRDSESIVITQCDDDNRCTEDSFDGSECVFTPIPDCCHESADCDDGNDCTENRCEDGACAFPPRPDFSSCSDGLYCNGEERCYRGECLAAADPCAPIRECDEERDLCRECATDTDCDDGIECSEVLCNADFQCEHLDICPGGELCNPGTGVCDAVSRTVAFQSGIDGYDGAIDTMLREDAPDTRHDELPHLDWSGDDPPGSDRDTFALIRFENLFETDDGVIPPDSEIVSATLTLNVFDEGTVADLHKVLIDWNGGVTYQSFGDEPGVQGEDFDEGFSVTVDGAMGLVDVDVTTAVARWSLDPDANRGWITIPAGSDTVEARSSEYEDAPSQRPRLTVDYVPPCDRGDGNRDGLVDLAELAALTACMTGPLGPIDPPRYLDYCGCFDADADGDIDIADFAMFQTVFSDEG